MHPLLAAGIGLIPGFLVGWYSGHATSLIQQQNVADAWAKAVATITGEDERE